MQQKATLLLFLAAAVSAGVRVPLNGEWSFRIGATEERVTVPHTWGVGPHAAYLGTAHYRKEFATPAEWRGKYVELHFGAVFYKARVVLNGQVLGEHEGGHTPFHFPVTAQLRDTNVLEVEVNNEPRVDTIPGFAMRLQAGGNIWYDWWHHGGIVRDVWLSVTEPVFIRRQQIRTALKSGAATVTTQVFVENTTARAQTVEITAGAARQTVTAPSGSSSHTLQFELANPALWYIDRPNLHTLKLEMRDAQARLLDSRDDTFGVRKIEIRDNKLLLNGEPVRLTGITRHEDSPWEGLAESAGTIRHDYRDLKELQVTLTRPVHYPQHPEVLDFCDRNGILLIPEIPIWQFSEAQFKDPRVRERARAMLREMVEDAFNHPSIFAWSVCNESETMKPGGVEYFREMKALLNSLDPDRMVTYADDAIGQVSNPRDYAASDADFIMMNQYFGSWAGPAEGLGPALDRVHAAFPNKMIVISELGLAGPFAPNPTESDKLRIGIARSQMEEFAHRPYIGGAIFWCYQDYRSHRNLWPGIEDGWVEMGIVDENRQRRPSYYYWKDRNTPVHIEAKWRGGGYAAPTGFDATIARNGETELPSYSLNGYTVEWEARDERGRLIARGSMPLPVLGSQKISGEWKPGGVAKVALTLRVRRPLGYTAGESLTEWFDPLFGGQTIDSMRKSGMKVP